MDPEPKPRRLPTTRVAIAIFAVLFGLLALGYYAFLRADYVQVFSDLRPADASAVVAQLGAKDIPYRLSDGGAAISVPGDQADSARLAIAGSDVALKGGVGFELFNKSDMGLTDFAQRINYQRALQGELERSIMMIDEVASARVHLALPERTIFRSERSGAKAAVEIAVKPGRQFDTPRVAGVQRLVSFAVPDLSPTDVVVLDGDGRLISDAGGDEATILSPDAEERRSVQGYYRARARAALQQILPSVETDVRVVVLPDQNGGAPAVPSAPDPKDAAQAAGQTKRTRTFALRVLVSSAAPIGEEETGLARNAVVAALGLDVAAGDELSFQVGIPPQATPPPRRSASSIAASEPERTWSPPRSGSAPFGWILTAVPAILVAGLLLGRRRRPARLNADEREAMVERVRAALRPAGDDHARA